MKYTPTHAGMAGSTQAYQWYRTPAPREILCVQGPSYLTLPALNLSGTVCGPLLRFPEESPQNARDILCGAPGTRLTSNSCAIFASRTECNDSEHLRNRNRAAFEHFLRQCYWPRTCCGSSGSDPPTGCGICPAAQTLGTHHGLTVTHPESGTSWQSGDSGRVLPPESSCFFTVFIIWVLCPHSETYPSEGAKGLLEDRHTQVTAPTCHSLPHKCLTLQ